MDGKTGIVGEKILEYGINVKNFHLKNEGKN